MDTRRQKRLRAPIASFEKSLEDPTGMVPTTTTTTWSDGDSRQATVTVDNNKVPPETTNGEKMDSTPAPKESHGNVSSGGSAAVAASYKRPPPLKATHTTLTTTTLVKSCEQQVSYKGATTLTTPSTPRIELSRASSSSHHEEDEEELDSRESSPENVFEQVGHGTLQETIGLGFREEGTLELRSSTEELYFMDPEQKKEEQEKLQHQQQQQLQQTAAKRSSPHIFRFEDHASYLQHHQRKDSASSEVAALLCISGRTSRISSVGSQGSAVSRLSAVSGVSRSPSPHRMLLETSFCGPKPTDNVVAADGRTSALSLEPGGGASELMEQVLLARTADPTQAVLAEGIQVKTTPAAKKKPTSLANGDSKLAAKIANQNKPLPPAIGAQRRSTKSPGQMVVGKTPSGTEYIRINLKPDHMYEDKGIGPNEKVVEAPNTLAPVYARTQKKPVSLSLGRHTVDENRLTPAASPKASRQGSRSPSPANVSVSRKSSFSSLFRLGKDSPDSPKDRARPRSKSKERPSQNATPSKQKSVLAIFKPGKRGSSADTSAEAKSTSPLDGHAAAGNRSKSQTPIMTATGSRPPSRLRYYDEPAEGGYIHIPLHTPPDEKATRELLQDIQQLNAEPVRIAAPITASQLAAAAAALKPVGTRKASAAENLNAIHRLPSKDEPAVSAVADGYRFSSQDSQDTDNSYAMAIKMGARSHLAHVQEASRGTQENGMSAEAEVHRLPSVESQTSECEARVIQTVATVTSTQQMLSQEAAAVAKERRRLLFATRLGSGSQEQMFSTQFSISKTESQSSQLSDQGHDVESEHLQRQITVIRRSVEEDGADKGGKTKSRGSMRLKSISTSEDDKTAVVQTTTVSAVVMRRKEVGSHCEEDGGDSRGSVMSSQRHSRYLENFDVRKKYQDNLPLQPPAASVSEMTEEPELAPPPQRQTEKPTLPHPPPPLTAPSPSPTPSAQRSASQSPVDREARRSPTPTKPPRTTTPTQGRRQPSPPCTLHLTGPDSVGMPDMPQLAANRPSANSTDEAVESSESERDSDLTTAIGGVASTSSAADSKRHHLPRHVDVHEEDHESTGLVSQESFDDELPYIPTTLPEERAQGVALIPMKDRANMELKTCPVERPRSTTPLNPSHLEEYYGIATLQEAATASSHPEVCGPPVRGEKLRISLPRKDSTKEKALNSKSPRRPSNASGKSWFEFAEEGLRAVGGNLERKDSNKQLLAGAAPQQTAHIAEDPKTKTRHGRAVTTTTPTTPNAIPSPSCAPSTQRKLSGHWIDFENIPEKRKPPKRITTLPKEVSSASKKIGADSQQPPQQPPHRHGHGHHHTDSAGEHYNYVKPEECQCECHEVERDITTTTTTTTGSSSGTTGDTDKPQALSTVDLLPQGEDLMPLLDMHDGIEPSDSSREYSCYTDDEMDMPVRRSSSSRSKGSSSKLEEFPRRDVSHSPRGRKFPDYKM